MASDGNSTDFDSLQQTFSWLQPGSNRTNLEQGCYQFAALVVTIAISVIGGIITGFILRIPVLDNPGVDEIYDDRKYWNISESGFPAITEEGNNQNGVNDKTIRLLKANDTEEI